MNNKLYLIYVTVPSDIFNYRLKYLIPPNTSYNYKFKDSNYKGFYAWSTNKQLVDRFLSERCDKIYKVKKVYTDDMEYGEYEKFKQDYSMCKLAKCKFLYTHVERDYYYDKPKDDEYEELVTTLYEFESCTNSLSENMMEFGPQAFTIVDYRAFKTEIQDALDALGYTSLYDSYGMCSVDNISELENEDKYSEFIEECSGRMDMASYNASFDLSVFGRKLLSFNRNEFAALIYLYQYLFLGE